MVWCCTWYGLYTLKNLISCPSLRRSTASFSTYTWYKNLITAILFKIGPVIVIKFTWSHDMSFGCCVHRTGGSQLLHSTTNGITQNFSIWRDKKCHSAEIYDHPDAVRLQHEDMTSYKQWAHTHRTKLITGTHFCWDLCHFNTSLYN